MPRLSQRMPDFQNVVAGGRATANLPVGATYNVIGIPYKLGGTPATEAEINSDIEEVLLKINGKEKIRLTGEELLKRYKYLGHKVKNGVIPLVFSQPNTRTLVTEDALGYGTADVSTMQIEVKIASGVIDPTLELFAEQSEGRPLGEHTTILPINRTVTSTGIVQEQNINKKGRLVAIHMTTGAVTKFELKANNNAVMDETKEVAEYLDELDGRGHVTQSGYTHINLVRSRRHSDSLPLDNLQSLVLETDHNATGSFKYLVERIEQFEG